MDSADFKASNQVIQTDESRTSSGLLFVGRVILICDHLFGSKKADS